MVRSHNKLSHINPNKPRNYNSSHKNPKNSGSNKYKEAK